MVAPYSLDAAIDSFFESNPTTATRRQCDDFALAHGTPVTPVQIQGMFSYTVLVGTDKIFQFRISSSSIDMDLLNLVTTTHREFVPRCKYHGTVGASQPLSIYEMDKLPGMSYILARDPDSVACQQRTVHELATFFAQSWNNAQPPSSATPNPFLAEFTQALTTLSTSLPAHFTPRLTALLHRLPAAFSALPLALTHGDLCEMNLLVDPATGRLTGVLDWAEARVLPFGLALYGLENALGWMDGGGWHYFEQAPALREGFWQVFRERAAGVGDEEGVMEGIEVARMVGVFYRYGFVFEGREVVRAVGEGEMGYLDAFCGGGS
ncbi:hypothetical protein C8A01DRAFT_37270 [Parachaetomium inaequale]|uniref:Aminoglycoside phosphotransferase domain-containing protein n=1 Tax=Parachaetomium inaequale TaxID=2588326 RepID=A0AAN6SQE9_9PEZI|nr:hypothetical protein C8A01DRAFT_37270 [Parachaetomium inaequale]